MRCEDVERRLDEREDGVLSEADGRELDEHLLGCPACREAADWIRDAGGMVREAVDAQPIRAGFAGEVMALVRADTGRARRRGAMLIGAGALTALAAVLLILAARRPIPPVRILGDEGGLLRIGAGPWRSLGVGDRIDADAWLLTCPDRRATVAAGKTRLLVHGDSLLRVGSDRAEILRGRVLVTVGPGGCRVVTPWGEVTAEGAVFAVSLRYGRDPVFRVGAGGRPELRGSLGDSEPGPGAGGHGASPGHAEVVAIEGRIRWQAGGAGGVLEPGRQIRLGPSESEGPTARAEPGNEPWMLRKLRGPGDDRVAIRRGSDGVRALIAGLDGSTPGARMEAAVALGRLCGRSDAAEAAVERLARESDVVVRVALLDAIRRLGGPDRADTVRDQLRDPDPSVREAALRCWIELRGPGGVEDIGPMIDDPEPRLRVLALESLLLLKDPAGRPWAVLALKDPEPAVVEAAERVLEALGDG